MHVEGRARRMALLGVVVTAFVALMAPGASVLARVPELPRKQHAPGVVLVGYEAHGARATLARSLSAVAARTASGLPDAEPLSGNGNAVKLTLRSGLSVKDAISQLQGLPGVAYAEPDYRVEAADVADDSIYTNGRLWGMYGAATSPASAYGTGAAEAWAAGHIGSRDIYVGVIDQGIQFDHPDLAANIWTNPYDPVDGVDNDRNGYIDDVHGWNFRGDSRRTYAGGAGGSIDAHGTHVAGTIGAVGGNGLGVAGVNWRVSIITAKTLGPSGGNVSDVVRALDYLTDLRTRHGLNIVATNNSWWSHRFSQALHDAINRAGDAGMLFVAAAGNFSINHDSRPRYPGDYQCTVGATGKPRDYDCVISVAAIGPDGTLASWSDFGAKSVDLGAPGVNIMSTRPGGRYGREDGTSMAAPHVTGALALCASIAPDLTAGELREVLIAAAAPTASLAHTTASGGRLDVGHMAALCAASAEAPPEPPADVIATPGDASATVSWSAPYSSGSPIERYVATSDPGGAVCSTTGLQSCTVTGLTNGASYTFTVVASNSFGDSTPSVPSNIVIPGDTTTPFVGPISVAVAPQTPGVALEVELSWPPGSDENGIVGYELEYSVDEAPWAGIGLALPSSTSAVFAAKPGQGYGFRLRARDGAGNVGEWSSTAHLTLAVLQETHPDVVYTGKFRRSRLAGASGGWVQRAGTSDGVARLTFDGTGVGFVTTLGPARGQATVWLDGTIAASLDMYSPVASKSVVFWSTALAPGEHVLEIRIAGAHSPASRRSRVDVDAFVVVHST